MTLRTSLPVQPHLYIGDVTGIPLDYGMVYFGEPNKDPEFYPIDIYYDEAMTIAAAQPVRTKGGFMNAFGDMVEVYADEQIYSVKVVDAYGYKIFYKPEMSKTNSGASVSTQQPFANAVVRTQDDKNTETVSVKDFGAVGDGITDDTSAIQKALDYAKANNATLLFPSGNYVSSNLSGLHTTQTDGDGIIKSGSFSWHIRPKGEQENTFYVSATGSLSNDGLSDARPTTLSAVNEIVQNHIGSKAGDGIWGLKMLAGTYTDNGIRLDQWAMFKSPFKWHGNATASITIEPKVIWSGNVANSNVYAILAQNISTDLNIDFKYIHFKDWIGNTPGAISANAGALVLWNRGEYHVEGCWFTNMGMGFSHRYSYGKVINSRFENCIEATSAGYQSTQNCGRLPDSGNLFVNCRTGATVGRTSIMYVQKNTFTDCDNDIGCAVVARVRPQGNTHTNWNNYAYYLGSGAVLTPDNGQGYPETYNNGNSKPIFYGEAGSFHSTANRGTVKTVNVSSTGEPYTLPTGTGISLLSSLFNNASYTPFRLPSWVMLSHTYSLELKVNMYARSGYAGRLVLSGNGATGGSAEIVGINIPAITTSQWLHMTVEVYSSGTLGSFIAFARIPELNLTSKTTGVVSEFLGAYSDDTLNFRLYGSNTGTDTLAFYGLRSYVEL